MSATGNYDVIVVGARAAGAATAMLLARRGFKVLAVDRAPYGSDTLSTHALMRTAVMQLHRWGLLDQVRTSNAFPIRRVAFHYPDRSDLVDIKPSQGIDALYAPRRTVLDRLLVDAARKAGAEIRFGVVVDGLQKDCFGRVIGISARDAEGRNVSPQADMVIGADGIRSVVAQAAGARVTRQASAGGAVVFGYFDNLEAVGYEWVYGPQVSAGLIPTNDGQVCVFAGGAPGRFRRDVQPDLAAGFRLMLHEASPEIAARVGEATQAGRFRGFSGVVGYARQAAGAGWALVGDAGYFRDPITTHGISDAFRDAELLARALDGEMTLTEFEQTRDRMSADLFEVTERIARYDWTIDEVRDHLLEVSRAVKPELRLLLGWEARPAA